MVSFTTEASEYQESDSANIGTSCSAKVCATPDIEKKYVHHVYDAIAPHFSATRFAKWPKVSRFLNSLSPGSVILDAGCGNGKYLGFNPYCFYIGCDISPPLIDICARKGHEVLVADAVNLPYKTNFGDAAISIAVLHHLSTESRRRKAIEELIRVVRKGGTVLITVWAVEQENSSLLSKWTPLSWKYNEGWVSSSSPQVRNSAALMLEQIPETNEDCRPMSVISKHEYTHPGSGEESMRDNVMAASLYDGVKEHAISSGNGKADANQEYFVPWHLPYHRVEVNGASTTAIANGLAKKDDKKGAVVYSRYYHVFAEGELQRVSVMQGGTTYYRRRQEGGSVKADQVQDKSIAEPSLKKGENTSDGPSAANGPNAGKKQRGEPSDTNGLKGDKDGAEAVDRGPNTKGKAEQQGGPY